jgi:hypothetical protein
MFRDRAKSLPTMLESLLADMLEEDAALKETDNA